MRKTLLVLGILATLAVGCNNQTDVETVPSSQTEEANTESTAQTTSNQVESTTQTLDFSKLSTIYKFSGQFLKTWKVEYVPGLESINIYDPSSLGNSSIEQSVIFIRHFSANNFLTLGTVDVLNRTETTVKGHAAVSYEIKKKSSAAKFAGQPEWRNGQHKLIDIRYTQASPSEFYVFSYNPKLSVDEFQSFIDSVSFHNDTSSLQQPMSQTESRITKKPFGIQVSPNNSPVSPERFTGFHNAVDYEILSGEENSEVAINAICGGILLSKQIVNGYGGLAIQQCSINDRPVKVIYGHIKISSIKSLTNSYLAPGDFLALLGEANSKDTDGNRKHLHLGINNANTNDIRGYVPNSGELSNWSDFTELIDG